jgi:hypothetical protein
VLDDAGQRFGHEEVGGGLDRPGQATDRDGLIERQRERVPARELVDRGGQSVVTEHGREDPGRQRPEVCDGVGQPSFEALERLLDGRVRRSQAAPRETRLQQERREPLLGSVVQVALDPAALRVGGFDDAGARVAQLQQIRVQLRLETGALKPQPGRPPSRAYEGALIGERGSRGTPN